MRGHRVLAMLALVAAFVLFGGAPASAGEHTFIEVTPNPAQSGTRVDIRASCDKDNNRRATVHSDAFGGQVFLQPNNGFLTGHATIPGSKGPGDYRVELRCDNNKTANTTLTVLNMSQPTKGPATGGGGTAVGRTGSYLLIGGVVAAALAVGFGFFGNRRTGNGA
ncbi:hypothetical protein Strop_3533 [Salinispora tropica CNB-440]|uniref:Uncharacterized protein n=2 Tax=Salinispora tropica TaxID=168695 RepID=A4XAL5_SALTO|nr:hypothetical protein Strop_3533 [Salinispora tropica CNB-440]